MEHHRGRRSVICEGDVGSAWEWCQIKLHTSRDVPALLNQNNRLRVFFTLIKVHTLCGVKIFCKHFLKNKKTKYYFFFFITFLMFVEDMLVSTQ